MNELQYQSVKILKDFINKANRVVISNYIIHLKKTKKISLKAENGSTECIFKFTLKNGRVTKIRIGYERKNMDAVMKALNTGNHQYFVEESKEPMEFFQNSPDRESLEALALNLRFFRDNKEAISLFNIEELYKKLKLPPLLTQEYSRIRSEFNKYLNSKSFFTAITDKPSISHREIFRTYLFGDLAHLNREKREKFLQWHRDPLKSIIFDASFIFIVISFSTMLEEMIKIHENTINYLDFELKKKR
jgi:hypothetical protein